MLEFPCKLFASVHGGKYTCEYVQELSEDAASDKLNSERSAVKFAYRAANCPQLGVWWRFENRLQWVWYASIQQGHQLER